MSRVQIVSREPGKDSKWEFVAHGARYDRPQADEVKKTREARGCKVRFLPV